MKPTPVTLPVRYPNLERLEEHYEDCFLQMTEEEIFEAGYTQGYFDALNKRVS